MKNGRARVIQQQRLLQSSSGYKKGKTGEKKKGDCYWGLLAGSEERVCGSCVYGARGGALPSAVVVIGVVVLHLPSCGKK